MSKGKGQEEYENIKGVIRNHQSKNVYGFLLAL
jgi:hypothetical protein